MIETQVEFISKCFIYVQSVLPMSTKENFEMVSRLITNLENELREPLLEEREESMDQRYLALTKKSTKEEVAIWLQEEGFLVARDKLKGITGKELYSTSKEELKKIIGFAESARLFSRLLKEKALLPAGEQTIRESDFERFMRIRREDVDSRIPSPNPVTSFDVPAPPKATRPLIREVFIEPQESVNYVEKVKKSKEKPVDSSSSKKTHAKHREESGKKDRKQRDSPRSTGSDSSEDDRRRRRHHKHSREKKVRDKEEGKGRKDKHKKSHKSKQSPQEIPESESETASGSEAEPQTPPRRSRHKNRKRRERERGRSQDKDKKKEEESVSPPAPLPSQHPYLDPLHPQMSPYGPVPQILPRPLSPQYPSPFPDPYTNQLMMQQAQIARAEQDRFAAEMRLRQLKSGFSAPGALPFPPPMPHFQNF